MGNGREKIIFVSIRIGYSDEMCTGWWGWHRLFCGNDVDVECIKELFYGKVSFRTQFHGLSIQFLALKTKTEF